MGRSSRRTGATLATITEEAISMSATRCPIPAEAASAPSPEEAI